MPLKLLVLLLALGLMGLGMKNLQTDSLNGTWIPIKQELAGAKLAATAFAKQKLVISDSTYTYYAESIDKGIARHSGGKMDIFGKTGVNSGKHFTAIYKLANDTLSICYNLSGGNYPSGFDTKGKPGFFLSIFTRGN